MKQHLCFSRTNRLKYVCIEKSSSRGVVIAPPTLCEDIMKYLPVFFMAVVVMVAVAAVLADVCYTHHYRNNFKLHSSAKKSSFQEDVFSGRAASSNPWTSRADEVSGAKSVCISHI